jgi:toxin-antitoxin system PIN domain toxin
LAVILCDVNVLVYAYGERAERHRKYLDWLTAVLEGDEAFGVADQVLSSLLRIVTNRRFGEPTTIDAALEFVAPIYHHPNARLVTPGPRHWDIFTRLCRETKATGNLVPDAYFAALAIEHGCEWITADRGFARFPGLRWRHPLDG